MRVYNLGRPPGGFQERRRGEGKFVASLIADAVWMAVGVG